MTLAAGSRLGPYEILSPLGAGGMGEVYKARDTRLERTVAIKVLSQHLSSSPDVRQRFEREAKTISQLSHPHICALYDVGREGETEYLVMEYLEGETLSERLSKGALPLEQTLRYGAQIAEALEKAHRQGIVHRDLKPGNVMLTNSGVKLLDFGLAKAIAAPGKQSGVTSFPTMAGGPNLTQEGTILGTFQYMAPEQLEGKEADSRTDIFALGAVLYEMATGKKAFSGASQASLISSIMKEDPAPISVIAPMTPPALDRVVRTCLAKDPEDRWQSARDVGNGLRWAGEDGSKAGVPAPVARGRRRREAIAWTVAAVATLAALIVTGLGVFRRDALTSPRRFVLAPPSRQEVQGLAVSPQGSTIAMTIQNPTGKPSLWLRELGSVEPRAVPGTDDANDPFWSPDGKHVGFFSETELKRIAVAGGPSQSLAKADNLGGAWNEAGTILYTTSFGRPLFRIPASGGPSEPVTALDEKTGEVAHYFPRFLPDGRHYVFFVRNVDPTKSGIWLGALDSRERRQLLLADGGPVYCDPGFLLFLRGGSLFGQAFDPVSRELTGDPLPLTDQVHFDPASNRVVASASSGLAVYRARTPANRSLQWFDRTGRQLGTVGPAGDYRGVSLSPDGKQLAVAVGSSERGTSDIWIRDLVRGTHTRITFELTDEFNPVWSPDGQDLYYTSDREGLYNIYRRKGAGSGAEELVLRDAFDKWVSDVASDGSALLYSHFDTWRSFDIWTLSLRGGEKPVPFRSTPFGEGGARFSPDSRWIAFAASGSGRAEIFISSRQPSSRIQQVSLEGGSDPLWSRDGRELYFLSPDGWLMVSALRVAGASLEPGPPRRLSRVIQQTFEQRIEYAQAPDGRLLITIEPEQPAGAPVVAILDWTAALRK